MTRGLATAISNATDDPFLVPVVFIELQFGSGTLRLHTDLGSITTTDTSPNYVWYGTGDLGSIDEIEETEELAATAIRCRLSGIDSTILDEAVNQDYYEKPARILVSMRDTVTGALVANPHEVFYGKMDVMRVLYGKDQSAIEVTLESELADFDKAAMKYYSDAQLQRDYSGDLFFQVRPLAEGLEQAHLHPQVPGHDQHVAGQHPPQGKLVFLAAQEDHVEVGRGAAGNVAGQDEVDAAKTFGLRAMGVQVTAITLGEEGKRKLHHFLQFQRAGMAGDLPAQGQRQGDADPGAAAQNAAAPIQGKELVDVEDFRLPADVEPGGPAVHGQDDAVLVKSCQGLGHRPPLRLVILFDPLVDQARFYRVPGRRKEVEELKRHLMTHYWMTPDDYRRKWGLAADYPMVAPNYVPEQRRALAKSIGLGTKRGKRKK